VFWVKAEAMKLGCIAAPAAAASGEVASCWQAASEQTIAIRLDAKRVMATSRGSSLELCEKFALGKSRLRGGYRRRDDIVKETRYSTRAKL
jgi:hypothetical protein